MRCLTVFISKAGNMPRVTSCVLRDTGYKKGLFPINISQHTARNPKLAISAFTIKTTFRLKSTTIYSYGFTGHGKAGRNKKRVAEKGILKDETTYCHGRLWYHNKSN